MYKKKKHFTTHITKHKFTITLCHLNIVYKKTTQTYLQPSAGLTSFNVITIKLV